MLRRGTGTWENVMSLSKEHTCTAHHVITRRLQVSSMSLIDCPNVSDYHINPDLNRHEAISLLLSPFPSLKASEP